MSDFFEQQRRDLLAAWRAFLSVLNEDRIPYPEIYQDRFWRCAKDSQDVLPKLFLVLEEAVQKLRKALQGISVAPEEVSALMEKFQALQRETDFLRQEYLLDELTGLWNAKAFRIYLERRVLPRVFVEDSSVALLDLDGFKGINDACGHRAGDQALKQFAVWLRRNLKGKDFAARLHGDEFAVVLGQTPLEKARRFLSELAGTPPRVRVRCSLEEGVREVELRFSAGLTNLIAKDDWRSVLDRADKAMYRAKRRKTGVETERI